MMGVVMCSLSLRGRVSVWSQEGGGEGLEIPPYPSGAERRSGIGFRSRSGFGRIARNRGFGDHGRRTRCSASRARSVPHGARSFFSSATSSRWGALGFASASSRAAASSAAILVAHFLLSAHFALLALSLLALPSSLGRLLGLRGRNLWGLCVGEDLGRPVNPEEEVVVFRPPARPMLVLREPELDPGLGPPAPSAG